MKQDDGEAPQDLDIGYFEAWIGRPIFVTAGGETYALELERTQALPGSPRKGGGFRLEFLGPPEPVFPQGIYGFAFGDEAQDIFIVPRGPDPEGRMQYEAVFF